jgi:hypothetical protein
MGNDIKIMIVGLTVTFLLVIGFAFWKGGQTSEPSVLADVSGIEVSPESFDLGEVPINGGLVTREYEIKNGTAESLKLAKIATSCMCTQAKVILGERETRFFGMEHATDRNPPVNFEIGAGETARVVVNFDPAAHGPEGVGPFDRVVWLTFADPAGVKELYFDGNVVN